MCSVRNLRSNLEGKGTLSALVFYTMNYPPFAALGDIVQVKQIQMMSFEFQCIFWARHVISGGIHKKSNVRMTAPLETSPLRILI
jgi:hypothetical protein